MTSAEVYNRYNTRKIKDFVQLIEVMKQMLKTIQSVSESFSSEILHALFTDRRNPWRKQSLLSI